jgi:hypothetical protein
MQLGESLRRELHWPFYNELHSKLKPRLLSTLSRPLQVELISTFMVPNNSQGTVGMALKNEVENETR